jgi:hypothetical protein
MSSERVMIQALRDQTAELHRIPRKFSSPPQGLLIIRNNHCVAKTVKHFQCVRMRTTIGELDQEPELHFGRFCNCPT